MTGLRAEASQARLSGTVLLAAACLALVCVGIMYGGRQWPGALAMVCVALLCAAASRADLGHARRLDAAADEAEGAVLDAWLAVWA